ncbi:MAG: phage holin family protein [Clostridia bacterium]
MEKFISLFDNDGMKVLVVVIVLDLILGVLRAIREKNVNSCIGIDGMIRKVGMLIVIVFLTIIDVIIDLNLIGFIPEQLREILNFNEVGISSLFNVLFVIFEILSIFKNMIMCKLPIPKKLQEYLEKIMKEFTGEIKEKEGEKKQ